MSKIAATVSSHPKQWLKGMIKTVKGEIQRKKFLGSHKTSTLQPLKEKTKGDRQRMMDQTITPQDKMKGDQQQTKSIVIGKNRGSGNKM
jgi:hypothetical protein